jgi:hypothetical protein
MKNIVDVLLKVLDQHSVKRAVEGDERNRVNSIRNMDFYFSYVMIKSPWAYFMMGKWCPYISGQYDEGPDYRALLRRSKAISDSPA